jgi:hypothetical protein
MIEIEEDKLIFMAHAENMVHKFLIKELSIAQREALAEAIQKWKDEKLADPNLVNNYINRNP